MNNENPVELSHEIDALIIEMNRIKEVLPDARQAYMQSKADYECNKARHFLETKEAQKDWTEKRIEAQSVVLSQGNRNSYIVSESKYRKLAIELKITSSQLDLLKEKSFNLRQEMRRV